MKPTLQARLVSYLQNNPHQRFAKDYLINLATSKMKVSAESVGRRLRVLAEVSKWGYRVNVDSPEHESGHKLLAGGKLNAERINGYTHYTYQPPATRQVRRVVVEGGVAREVYETVNT